MGKTKVKIIEAMAEPATQAEETAAKSLLDKTEQEITKELEDKNQQGKKLERKHEAKKAKKAHKIRSKKYQDKAQLIDKNKLYPLEEAVQTVKKASFSTFDGSFEININTNSKNLRGLISLPYAAGKKLTILAFGKDAEHSDADLVGTDQTISDIGQGKINFDVIVTTAEWMPKLAKIATILGPKGLMPNPKNGTISTDLKKAVADLHSGKTEYKTEKSGQVVHLAVGKISQPDEEISQNIKMLLATIGKSKIKKVTLSPTMGPAVKLNFVPLFKLKTN